MSYTSKLNLCLSPATSLGGSDASATKGLPTRRLTNRLNFALAGYGLLAGGSGSAPEPAIIATTVSTSGDVVGTVTETTNITYTIQGG
jgi:hypothetical protein